MRTLRSLLLVASLLASACNLVVDTNITQCRSDSDCARFATVCNLDQHVCVAAVHVDAALAPDGRSCVGPGGCFSCTPTTEAEITAQCTDSECVPFDNNRIVLLTADGRLRPLP